MCRKAAGWTIFGSQYLQCWHSVSEHLLLALQIAAVEQSLSAHLKDVRRKLSCSGITYVALIKDTHLLEVPEVSSGLKTPLTHLKSQVHNGHVGIFIIWIEIRATLNEIRATLL